MSLNFVLHVVCFIVLVNCLFNALVICLCILALSDVFMRQLPRLSILPFVMWCLSACRMMLVSILFAVCGLVSIFAILKAVFFVNLIKLVFLLVVL